MKVQKRWKQEYRIIWRAREIGSSILFWNTADGFQVLQMFVSD